VRHDFFLGKCESRGAGAQGARQVCPVRTDILIETLPKGKGISQQLDLFIFYMVNMIIYMENGGQGQDGYWKVIS
jgi:hypothetical protein